MFEGYYRIRQGLYDLSLNNAPNLEEVRAGTAMVFNALKPLGYAPPIIPYITSAGIVDGEVYEEGVNKDVEIHKHEYGADEDEFGNLHKRAQAESWKDFRYTRGKIVDGASRWLDVRSEDVDVHAQPANPHPTQNTGPEKRDLQAPAPSLEAASSSIGDVVEERDSLSEEMAEALEKLADELRELNTAKQEGSENVSRSPDQQLEARERPEELEEVLAKLDDLMKHGLRSGQTYLFALVPNGSDCKGLKSLSDTLDCVARLWSDTLRDAEAKLAQAIWEEQVESGTAAPAPVKRDAQKEPWSLPNAFSELAKISEQFFIDMSDTMIYEMY